MLADLLRLAGVVDTSACLQVGSVVGKHGPGKAYKLPDPHVCHAVVHMTTLWLPGHESAPSKTSQVTRHPALRLL